jgi:hypothetical protein
MKKILATIVASVFLFSAVGWTFDVNKSNNLNSQKNFKSTSASVEKISKALSYTNVAAPKKATKTMKKATGKKLIHKSTSVTKKTIHKKGNTTTTTTTVTTTKHK